MTAQEMISKYNITLATEGRIYISRGNAAKKDGMVNEILATKPEIVAILIAEKEAAEKAAAERKAKIEGIEGLKEIEKSDEDWEEYHYRWNKYIANDGMGTAPEKPASDPKALREKYPRAAAYIKARSWDDCSGDAKSSAGRRAAERIINGEDYTKVIAEMEKEWADYCGKHVWD